MMNSQGNWVPGSDEAEYVYSSWRKRAGAMHLPIDDESIFTDLYRDFNTIAIPLQTMTAFYHDVLEMAQLSPTTEAFRKNLHERKLLRVSQLRSIKSDLFLEFCHGMKELPEEARNASLKAFYEMSIDAILRFLVCLVETPEGYIPATVEEPLDVPPFRRPYEPYPAGQDSGEFHDAFTNINTGEELASSPPEVQCESEYEPHDDNTASANGAINNLQSPNLIKSIHAGATKHSFHEASSPSNVSPSTTQKSQHGQDNSSPRASTHASPLNNTAGLSDNVSRTPSPAPAETVSLDTAPLPADSTIHPTDSPSSKTISTIDSSQDSTKPTNYTSVLSSAAATETEKGSNNIPDTYEQAPSPVHDRTPSPVHDRTPSPVHDRTPSPGPRYEYSGDVDMDDTSLLLDNDAISAINSALHKQKAPSKTRSTRKQRQEPSSAPSASHAPKKVSKKQRNAKGGI